MKLNVFSLGLLLAICLAGRTGWSAVSDTSLEGKSWMEWYSAETRFPQGVVLLLHGLNLKPEKMGAIRQTLTESGNDVLQLHLQGHGKNIDRNGNCGNSDIEQVRLEAFKRVNYRDWRQEVLAAYRIVRQRSTEQRLPLHFVGFSLGGLLGVELLASDALVQFNKMVLFAPALRLRYDMAFLNLLAPFPRLVIPSLSPQEYLANYGTPVSAYLALRKSKRNLNKYLDSSIDIPTVVFMNPSDELISYNKIKKFISRNNLDRWILYPVKKSDGAKEEMHHLIIGPDTLGKESWYWVSEILVAHFTS